MQCPTKKYTSECCAAKSYIPRRFAALLPMLSVTHIMPVPVILSVVGVGMQQCMIRNKMKCTSSAKSRMDTKMQLIINSFRRTNSTMPTPLPIHVSLTPYRATARPHRLSHIENVRTGIKLTPDPIWPTRRGYLLEVWTAYNWPYMHIHCAFTLVHTPEP